MCRREYLSNSCAKPEPAKMATAAIIESKTRLMFFPLEVNLQMFPS
jgi:hypothetical protein